MSKHNYIMVSMALRKIMEHIIENNEPDIDHIHSLAYRALKNYGPKIPDETDNESAIAAAQVAK